MGRSPEYEGSPACIYMEGKMCYTVTTVSMRLAIVYPLLVPYITVVNRPLCMLKTIGIQFPGEKMVSLC